jgi:hypothetical protein
MSQRIEVGESPQVEIAQCAGDVDIKGVIGTLITLSGDEPRCEVLREGPTVRVTAPGDCRLRVPEGAALSIGQVERDMRVKRVRGLVRVSSVARDCIARGVDTMDVGAVEGSVHIKYATGPVTLGSASGDVALRGIAGPIQVGPVAGDLYALDIEGGAEVERIDGDLSVRTAFQEGASYRFGPVGGDVMFRLGPDADVRFVIPASVEMRVKGGPEPVMEGEHMIVVFGEGLAEVIVEQIAGDLQIKGDDAEFAGYDGDLDAHLARVAAEVDARLEETLSGVPYIDSDAIRDRVRRKMDSARRRVVSGRRDVDFSVGRRSHRAGAPGSRGWEPPSEEERLAILQMVEEGKISVEEAEKLLSALEGED